MKESELLERYDAMSRFSQQMLTAAKQAEWDRLIELEQARAAIVEELRREDNIAWHGSGAEKKEKLIRSVLIADTEVKKLTEAWMGKLRENLDSASTEKKLQKAYGSF